MNIVKKDAAITNTDDTFPGSFEVILSAPTKDRDGDTLLPGDWKMPLPDHITFDMDHAMTVAGTVGSGVPSLNSEGQLTVAGTYSSLPRAQEVRTLVNEGHIKTTSVAFMSEPAEMKDGKQRRVRELLNGAFVAIPSNREALVLASKSATNVIPKAGARNAKSDMTHIQAIHDHAVALGATADASDGDSAAKALAEQAARKSIVGSLEATQDRINDALSDAFPSQWPCLRGSLPAGDGGTVVYDLTTSDWTYERQTFRQTYTDDGAVVTLTGTPEPVDIMEIVTPDADEDEDPALAVYTASATEARSLIADIDLTTLPDAVQKAFGLLVPPLETSTEKSVVARSAELAPAAQAPGAPEAVTPADDEAELLLRAAQFRAYSNLTAPERG